MKQKRQSVDMWVPASLAAKQAYQLFLRTTSAHSPGDATEIFDVALEHLRSSVSWIPNRQPKIDVWNTEIERDVLVDVLDHLALDNIREPMTTIIGMRRQSSTE